MKYNCGVRHNISEEVAFGLGLEGWAGFQMILEGAKGQFKQLNPWNKILELIF